MQRIKMRTYVSILHTNQPSQLILALQFLALRLLNKRSRVKLSPDSLKLDPLPGKGVLFATANSIGYFAAATCTTTNDHSEHSSLLTTGPRLHLKYAQASYSQH